MDIIFYLKIVYVFVSLRLDFTKIIQTINRITLEDGELKKQE
jgi:hypothetical protein